MYIVHRFEFDCSQIPIRISTPISFFPMKLKRETNRGIFVNKINVKIAPIRYIFVLMVAATDLIGFVDLYSI